MCETLEFADSDVEHWSWIIEAGRTENVVQQSKPGGDRVEDIDEIKAQIKKLNARATNLKMNLHDLAEDLPTGWEKIPEVAEQAYQAYKSLTEARSRLAAAGG